MNDLSNVIKDASGRITSWAQGTLQYRVLRDAQGKPLQVTQFPKDPYNGVMSFKYNPDGTLESVKDLGLIDPVITNVLKEEALNKGGVGATATPGPGGGNRLLAGNLPADMAQLSNVVVAGGLLRSWTANGIDYVATYSSGKVATVTASDGWVQTYAWAGDVPTITVAKG